MNTPLCWINDRPVSVPHPAVPLLIGTPATWTSWRGEDESDDAIGDFEGELGTVMRGDTCWVAMPYTGGEFHLGIGSDELVILQTLDTEDDEEHASFVTGLREAISKGQCTEYLAGEIEVLDSLVIGDGWTRGFSMKPPSEAAWVGPDDGQLFVVPVSPGRYLVLEGRHEEDDDLIWLRFAKGNPADYSTREHEEELEETPAERIEHLIHELEHVQVSGKRIGAKTSPLSVVRQLIDVGGAAQLGARCDAMADEAPAVARWMRVLLLGMSDDESAVERLRELATEWLEPASSPESVNQQLPRADLVAAFDAVQAAPALKELRNRVKSAPEPEVFVLDGDFF